MVLSRTRATGFSSTVHAVVVGVNSVPGNWLPNLVAPERDATRLATALQSRAGCAVPPLQVISLTGPMASQEAVTASLSDAVARLGPEDSLIFYFAGHGLVEAGDFRLCVSDARADALERTAISGEDLERLFATAVCRGILVILDCCEGAAFAEYAPATFRTLRQGEYRILVASARSDQKSWERLDGSGTLFSNAFIEIVTGDVCVGNVPGAIYFSDLVQGIDAQIAESLQARPDSPHQEMVFVGSYTRDPLILVHRELSLQQVQFATARYSPAYVRRTLGRALIAVAALVFFVGTTAYGVLDATQYVVEENGRLVVFRGHPDYNLPGYPRRLWSLPYGTDRLEVSAAERKGFRLVSALGGEVMSLVEARIRPDHRAWQYSATNRREAARALALELITHPGVSFEYKLNAHLVFPLVAERRDIPLLESWLSHERSEIRLAALRGLMAMDPARGFAAARNIVDDDPAKVHVEVLRQVAGPCSPELNAYLENRFDVRGSHPTNQQIYDAAVRTKCRLSVQALTRSAMRPQLFGDRDAALFASLNSYEAPFAEALAQRLEAGDVDMWRKGTLIGTMAELPKAPCSKTFMEGLQERLALARLLTMVAISRHCPGARLDLRWNSATKRFDGTFVDSGRNSMSIQLDPQAKEDRNAIQYLIRARPPGLETATLGEGIHVIAKATRDDHFKVGLIRTLIEIHDARPLPESFLDSNNIDVRRAVVEHRRSREDSGLLSGLMTRIGGSDEFYVGMLGRIRLDETHRERLRSLLGGNLAERRQAACILAMQDDPDRVVTLLTSPDQAIRSEATACAPYNEAAVAIASKMPSRVRGFPVDGYQFVQEQVARKTALQRDLNDTPEGLRYWRISIVDTTPGGWGLWGRGMRYWLEEQRYQLSRATRNTKVKKDHSVLFRIPSTFPNNACETAPAAARPTRCFDQRLGHEFARMALTPAGGPCITRCDRTLR